MNKHKNISARGFTLIEVLVVIGIIAILATVVLVAVNPARQFKLARDSQRTSNINAILNAIHQNISEHRGVFVCGTSTRAIPSTLTLIESTTTTSDYVGDIASCLVPDYISAIPFDPSYLNASFTSTSSYLTGYSFLQDDNGRLTISAVGELTADISVTR